MASGGGGKMQSVVTLKPEFTLALRLPLCSTGRGWESTPDLPFRAPARVLGHALEEKAVRDTGWGEITGGKGKTSLDRYF